MAWHTYTFDLTHNDALGCPTQGRGGQMDQKEDVEPYVQLLPTQFHAFLCRAPL